MPCICKYSGCNRPVECGEMYCPEHLIVHLQEKEKMKERTEEQKIFKSPLIVVFAGKEYEVAPLVIKESRKWRQEVVKLMASLPKYAKTTTDDPEEFEGALTGLLVALPDSVVDLFFSYAKDLNRDEIEAVATDAEVAEAFKQVIALAFPLTQSLPEAMMRATR